MKKIHTTGSGAAPGEDVYIFDICPCTDHSVMVSSSDHHLTHFDRELNAVSRFVAHSDSITAVEAPISSNNSLVVTSSADKSIRGWDVRCGSGNAVFQQHCTQEVLSLSCLKGVSSNLLAAACGNDIHFYDFRMSGSATDNSDGSSKLVSKMRDMHTEEVTALSFCPGGTMLLSGGEDGLVNVIDISIAGSEECVISVLNNDCPVRRLGSFGAHGEGVYVTTSVETLNCWHAQSAQRLGQYSDLREQFPSCDYIVDCWAESGADAGSDQDASLSLLCGSYEGDGKVFCVYPDRLAPLAPLQPPQPSPTAAATGMGEAPASSPGGHSAMLRCCSSGCFTSAHTGKRLLLTGGEDSLLCLWELGAGRTAGSSAGAARASRLAFQPY